LVGIDVKASATVNFQGAPEVGGRQWAITSSLERLSTTSRRPVPFGDRLVAALISCLWGVLDFRGLWAPQWMQVLQYVITYQEVMTV